MKSFLVTLFSLASYASNTHAFAPTTSTPRSSMIVSSTVVQQPVTNLKMMDVSTMMDVVTTATASTSSSSLMLSETEEWVQPLATVLGPFLNIFSFAMVS